MQVKRMVLLASMALAAVAFAAPATASADATWTHEGVPVTGAEEKKFTLHGNLTTTALGNQNTCTFTAHLTLLKNGGGSAFLTEVANGTEGVCMTTTPNCTLHRVTNTSPWPITATAPNRVDISEISFTRHYVGRECGAPTVTTIGNLTATVDNGSEISSVSFGVGAGTLKIANMFDLHIDGTLNVVAPDAKTYGIE